MRSAPGVDERHSPACTLQMHCGPRPEDTGTDDDHGGSARSQSRRGKSRGACGGASFQYRSATYLSHERTIPDRLSRRINLPDLYVNS